MSRTHKDTPTGKKKRIRMSYLSPKGAYKVHQLMKLKSKKRRKTLGTEDNPRALKLGLTNQWFFD